MEIVDPSNDRSKSGVHFSNCVFEELDIVIGSDAVRSRARSPYNSSTEVNI